MLGCLSLGAFCLRQVAYGAQGSSICSDPQAVVTESPRGVSVDSEAGWGRDTGKGLTLERLAGKMHRTPACKKRSFAFKAAVECGNHYITIRS